MAHRLRTAAAGGTRPLPFLDLDHVLATASVALGAIGLLLVAVGLPLGGVLLGVAGVGVGLWGQMVSRTRGERFTDMAGLLLSFLSLAVGLAQATT